MGDRQRQWLRSPPLSWFEYGDAEATKVWISRIATDANQRLSTDNSLDPDRVSICFHGTPQELRQGTLTQAWMSALPECGQDAVRMLAHMVQLSCGEAGLHSGCWLTLMSA